MPVLKKLENFNGRPGPVVLLILDGVGLGKKDESDGVHLAKTPRLDQLMSSPLYTTLKAHGTAVGMPTDDDMGNSEVGHNALGAGRIFAQGATLVQNSIKSGDMFKGETWNKLTQHVQDQKSTFHLLGLLSDGNVHSHIDHVIAMLNQLASQGVYRVRLHALLDGRDVFERSALEYIQKVEEVLAKINQGKGFDYQIASGGGRMITTMDRYNADWTIVERGWRAHVLGEARAFASAADAVQTMYDEDPKITDQYLESFVITENGQPVGTIQDDDAVVFFNFRGDRAIEMSMAFETKDDFQYFDRKRVPNILFAGMMEYDGDQHIPSHYLVNPPQIDSAISTYLCASGIKSGAISETQKYGHVTYFWNGNRSGYVNEALETYIEVPSDKIQYDKAPKMKAYEITEKTLDLIHSGDYQFIRVNFPNGDMVGHTGVPEAIIASMEAVDECMGKIIDAVNEKQGLTIVLADHGNADEMFTVKKGEKKVSTAHSLNPVPFAIVDSVYDDEYKIADLDQRGLANVAATIINLLGFEAPADYEPSLIRFS